MPALSVTVSVGGTATGRVASSDGLTIRRTLGAPSSADIALVGHVSDFPAALARSASPWTVLVQSGSTTLFSGRARSHRLVRALGSSVGTLRLRCAGYERTGARITDSVGRNVAAQTSGSAQLRILATTGTIDVDGDDDPAPGDFRYESIESALERVSQAMGAILIPRPGTSGVTWDAYSAGNLPSGDTIRFTDVANLSKEERVADQVNRVILRAGDLLRTESFTGDGSDTSWRLGEGASAVQFISNTIATDRGYVTPEGGSGGTPDRGLRFRDRVETKIPGSRVDMWGVNNIARSSQSLYIGTTRYQGWKWTLQGTTAGMVLTFNSGIEPPEPEAVSQYSLAVRSVSGNQRWVLDRPTIMAGRPTRNSGIDITYHATRNSGLLGRDAGRPWIGGVRSIGSVVVGGGSDGQQTVGTSRAPLWRETTGSGWDVTLEAHLRYSGSGSPSISTSGTLNSGWWLRRLIAHPGDSQQYWAYMGTGSTSRRLIGIRRTTGSSGTWSVSGINVSVSHEILAFDGQRFWGHDSLTSTQLRAYTAAGARDSSGDVNLAAGNRHGQSRAIDWHIPYRRSVVAAADAIWIPFHGAMYAWDLESGARSAHDGVWRGTYAMGTIWRGSTAIMFGESRSGSTNTTNNRYRGFNVPQNQIVWPLSTAQRNAMRTRAGRDRTFDVAVLDCGIEGIDCPGIQSVGAPAGDVRSIESLTVGSSNPDVDGDAWSLHIPTQELRAKTAPANNTNIRVVWKGRQVVGSGSGTTAVHFEEHDSIGRLADARSLAATILAEREFPTETLTLRLSPASSITPEVGQVVTLDTGLASAAGVRTASGTDRWIVSAVQIQAVGGLGVWTVTVQRGSVAETAAEWWRRRLG